jgi:hypothetical protein
MLPEIITWDQPWVYGICIRIALFEIAIEITCNGPWVAINTDILAHSRLSSLIDPARHEKVGERRVDEELSSCQLSFLSDGGQCV